MSRTVACLLAQAGSHLCAVPVADVVETMRPLMVERLPGMPPLLLGLALVRGAAVPVVDLAGLFAERCAARSIGRWVVTRTGERRLALAVDAVIGVADVEAVALDAGERLAAEVAAPCVAAVTTHDGRALTVLDVARILPAISARRVGEVSGVSEPSEVSGDA